MSLITDPTPAPPLQGRGVPTELPAAVMAAAAPLPSARALLACHRRDARRGVLTELPAAVMAAAAPLPSRGGVGGGVCNYIILMVT